MWNWLEKIIGTYEKPLRLTKDMEVKPKKKKTKKKIALKKKPKKKRKVKKDPYSGPWNGVV